MKNIFKIEIETILTIVMIITMIFMWIAFIKVSDVYMLAIAVIITFMTLIVAICHETLKEFREEILKRW